MAACNGHVPLVSARRGGAWYGTGVPDDELDVLLAAPESDRVERKESLNGRVKDRVCEAICAFANDYPDHRAPGVVVVGQRDDGSCAGTAITDALIQEATFEEEQRLAERRRWKNLPFDVQPLPSVETVELDREHFRSAYLPGAIAPDIYAANHRDVEGQLLGLRMVDPTGAPTVLGVLLLGVDPPRWIAGSYIQFLRFQGTQLTDPIRDQKEITGRVSEVIRRAEEILEANIAIATRFVDLELEERRPDYPLAALRQLLRNAVMHRSYDHANAPIRIHWFDDRIEIQNPGGPYGQVTRENFGAGVADYRNPNLAAALRDLGFVQRFGQGIPQAQAELVRNHNPPLEWELASTHTLLRVKRIA